ncbi:FAD-dependent oxidoreductase [Planctomycetaceae bacterium]|jgi:uncharacterized protein|nr:FAD-dependent oxidoreductase [Planctomycetaceae bacterium]
MSIRLTNLETPVEFPEAELPKRIAHRLKLPVNEVQQWKILRKSLDARSSHNLKFVYSVIVSLHDPEQRLTRFENDSNVKQYIAAQFDNPTSGSEPLDERPVIVGSGPAGLLAGYYLAWKGYRPIILERGQPVKERVAVNRDFDRGGDFDCENNYLFGEGGAGCFSDGKLTCRMSGADVDWVIERFIECGGRSSIAYENRPHLGSNKLPMICRNFRRKIEAMGGEYQFGCRFESLDLQEGQIRGVHTSSGYLPTKQVLLGIGHSARDTYQTLYEQGIPMERKAFQLGLRIEQPQENVNRHKYGKKEYLDILGAADYSMVANGERDLYTFCMCAGGIVMPSVSEPERFCTNGMSNSRHDSSYANSGLMITLEPEQFGSDHPLAGIELQRQYESIAFALGRGDYLCPLQSADDFLNDRSSDTGRKLRSSYERGSVSAPLAELLPPVVTTAIKRGLPVLDQKWKGEYLKDAILAGPEMRGSSPVRIARERETFVCPGVAGLYPIGEGAGYAGGIVSAAVDGLRSAREIVRKFQSLEPVEQL